jgi:hypothetical protein
MLEFLLNQCQTYYGYLCDLCPLTAFIFSDFNNKMVIFLFQTESTRKHFFLKKSTARNHEHKKFLFIFLLFKTFLKKNH